jgi:glycosyltransferase involved in cell wall biosynthesis
MKTALIVLGEGRLTRSPHRLDCTIAEAVKYSLNEIGIKTKIVGSYSGRGSKTDLLIVLWGTEGIKLKSYSYKTAIHITSEQLPFYNEAPERVIERWNKIKQSFKEYDCILEHSSLQTDWLITQSYKAIHFPWGYTPTMDVGDTLSTTNYEVCFMGSITARRKKVLKQLSRFKLHDTQVHEERGQMVRQAAINLNIHNADSGRGSFAAGRVVCLQLGNGAFVISELPEQGEILPLIGGKHLVYAAVDEFSDKIQYYLTHKEKRMQIAQQGYQFVKQHYTMTQNLKKALKEAQII